MKRQPTSEQKAKAEERREHLRGLWERVAALSEEERATLATKVQIITTCEGHELSANNTILLYYQYENTTVIGGFQQWRKAGRQVKKGERAMGIWIPAKQSQKESKDKKPSFFVFGSVFDISQTDPIGTPNHFDLQPITENEAAAMVD